MSEILNYFTNLPLLELTAMLLALAYVILAAKGSLWCWPAAFISTALYTYIFYDVLLLMDSALNGYYLVMAVYGYWCWQQKPSNNNDSDTALAIVSWQLSWHIKACLILAVIASALGYFMANYTPAAFPYLDTFTTVYAVFATYLVTQKVLENWLYWIVIDLVSIYLYIEKSLLPTAVLFVIYVVIAGYGYLAWRKQYQHKKITLEPAILGEN
ncbi:nicotinamide riboside transporter PnuC [Litorilituus lipolyticus]|uniref:Nicotinamide riboside transporter PnuC n=1 Tax=Litorilituus lipolyticus TaxID=2491017 RepID=A0A502KNX9_9GAMM|nr:nicotinamide riboside transporter PnuC [Litorilituus lipolyticus]TPH13338.1 nicotinamide riboside transporter PnuC [Litorilituus lipolyticus]